MMDDFEYSQNGRRPVVWLFLAVGLGFLAFLFVEPGPVVVWVILAAYLALILWLIIANPVQGIRITRHDLIIAPEREAQRVPLADINHLAIDTRSDTTDFTLHLRDGETIAVHSSNVPSTQATVAAFEARGIAVRVV